MGVCVVVHCSQSSISSMVDEWMSGKMNVALDREGADGPACRASSMETTEMQPKNMHYRTIGSSFLLSL